MLKFTSEYNTLLIFENLAQRMFFRFTSDLT
ncbi:hypothetical protein EHW99_2648 [Erwinia amylovora]|uniref:Uncharacterized protein n=2 Tax=Erwinia amylovora TaxID=552 RepID=A0A830ZZU8_ERWAM|nr:hypothetical protein EaACW_0941 [Erwinia amylovora ACW56400]QJQ55350.1 hypothetical protein EHX00_2648 [Erwinia amylovora]CBA19882.1 hypothetical protein predicted by Glimmer/Critica [Erwinia amylovora CFBP1430]CCO77784.1 hypothetical protein BN432_0962 [Erwinia amylovora Ea356]CCO85372.1 hypothetical protein BN434_0960 [Erwinia amylovora CFBP 2585]CCO89156.1 hypothetical protein BN435_0960 [Erwinia amylovora 01SFR-BO]CCO92913.1 hypothetical protein BN437_0959 [Erwinia amylovora NBRC 12687